MDAVGIEPSPVHPVSHDSIAITRKRLDAETQLKPSESGLRNPLGTPVLCSRWSNELLERSRVDQGVYQMGEVYARS
jgi:hypothetical protein